MIDTFAGLVMLAGALLLVLAAWGVIVLPDTLARQHAATKSGTLAVALILVGMMIKAPSADWVIRLGFIVLFLLVTLPLASHMLARAAVRESRLQEDVDKAPLVD
jgi:multicomponent Na+:H+ antiporter subunit G